MAYADDYALATNQTFLSQLLMSIVKAANSISSEAPTADATKDAKRSALATRILNTPNAFTSSFAFACVATGTLTGTPTDAAVDTAVASVWNGIAGISSRD